LPQSAIALLSDADSDAVGAVDAMARHHEPAPPEIGAKPRIPTQPALCRTVADVANANDLPIPFFANLIWAESSFNAKVISRAGAQGIAQFMPKTAVMYGLENPFEPVHAINVSARFLVKLREQFGNLGLAAAAYNAGPGRVSNWLAKGGSLPRETQRYVRKITGRSVEQWVGEENVARAAIEPMPARAPCIEVAEAVLEQTRLARVANLMRDLVGSVPPAEQAAPNAPDRGRAETAVARVERKALPLRVTKLRPSVKDMRGRTRMAEAKPAKAAKLEASASRKAASHKSPKRSKLTKATKPDIELAKAPAQTPSQPPAPAKASNKPITKPNAERNQSKPMRRTRFAFSIQDNLH
jgi:hypothetical protein